MMTSACIASMLARVSCRVSPLTELDELDAMARVSALSRFAASSNEVRVRVLGSWNQFTTSRPLSRGTFLIPLLRSKTSMNCGAVSRISSSSARDNSRMPSRSFLVQTVLASRKMSAPASRPSTRGIQQHHVLVVDFTAAPTHTLPVAWPEPAGIRLMQFAPAPVHEAGQLGA